MQWPAPSTVAAFLIQFAGALPRPVAIDRNPRVDARFPFVDPSEAGFDKFERRRSAGAERPGAADDRFGFLRKEMHGFVQLAKQSSQWPSGLLESPSYKVRRNSRDCVPS